MAKVLASSAVDCGFEPCSVKPKIIRLVFVSFSQSSQHSKVRVKIGWHKIRITCPRAMTCLLVNY